jgi:glycosyltransferase involved in cell wall biosynthesis
VPVLSIITINYNDANGLKKTIDSVVNQSFTNYEYIVIDGGSTDESKTIIESYGDRITYWVSAPDKGIYNAMNKGIIKASGEYCLFLNSGDSLYSKEVLSQVFSFNPQEDLLACDLVFDYDKDKFWNKLQPDSLSFIYMMRTSLFHPSTFIKRTLFRDYGNYNEQYKIAADYDFFLKTSIVKNVSYKHLSIIVSRFNTNGISSDMAYIEKNKEERLLIQKQYFPENIIKDTYNHNALFESNSFKLYAYLKQNKFIYSVSRVAFNFLLQIKRFIKN